MTEIKAFGIRHHGPGSARALRRALEAFEPDVVVIEGPSDADPLVKHVGSLEPPVALLAWSPDEPAKASFWPFAVFSPEWQALAWARRRDREVAFMDLPSSLSLAAERTGDRVDAIGLLAAAGGYDDPERWWEDLVEQRDADPFDVVAEAMAAIRDVEEVDDETLVREAHMRKVIRAAARNHSKVAVVCGAFHVPAVTAKVTVAADTALLKGLTKVPTQLTWVPWSHGRLTYASGYGAGVRSPGWYHHLFTVADESVARWLSHIARVLRTHDLPTSSAHVIEAVRTAEALAVLRGRPSAGLGEVQDATLAVLCEGSELAFELVTREAVVGERLGAVGDDVPRTPFDADLHATARRLRLPQSASAKEFNLDLRKPGDLARSHFLRRLRILGIGWGALLGQVGLGTFKERWELTWEPELAVAVVDAARWGNTVELAAASRLLASTQSLADVTVGIEHALVAELPTALPDLLRLLDERAAAETDVAHLLTSLAPLVRSHRYGDVRGTHVERLGDVIEAILGRACAGLPAALGGLAPEAAQEMRTTIDGAHFAVGLLSDEAQQLWRETLLRALDRADLPGLVAGRIVRLLFDGGHLDVDHVGTRLSLALSGGHPPAEQAAWVEGLLTGSSLLLLHNPSLLRVVDGWVRRLDDDAFTDVLPVVRRAFGGWSAPERRALADRVQRLDSAPATGDAESTFEGLEAVVATVELILGGGR